MKAGDSVSVLYVGRLQDGSVFDTNVKEVGEASGLQKLSYEPLQFQVGAGQMIQGFDEGVVGMKKGEKKIITVPPEKGYGQRDPRNIIALPRVQEVNRTEKISETFEWPLANFQTLFGREPVVDEVVNNTLFPVPYRVMGKNSTHVVLKANLVQGMPVRFPSLQWDSLVLSIENGVATIRHNPENGQQIETPIGNATITVNEDKLIISANPEVGRKFPTPFGSAVVASVNATNVIVDLNHELAGKTLTFEVDILDIKEGNATPPLALPQQPQFPVPPS